MTVARTRVKLTSAATRNVVDQADFYRAKSGHALATRWRLAVKDTVASLRTMPHRGELCRFEDRTLNHIRRIESSGFERFSVFYRIDVPANLTLLQSIVHEARDIESLLLQTL